MSCGPAAILQQANLFRAQWEQDPAVLSTSPAITDQAIAPAPCSLWQQLSGDAGHAGLLLRNIASTNQKNIVLVVPESADRLRLFTEAISLLAPADRWKATFTTLGQNLPSTVTCRWSIAIAGTKRAREAIAHPGIDSIELEKLPTPPEDEFTAAARAGRMLAGPDAAPSQLIDPRRRKQAEQPPVASSAPVQEDVLNLESTASASTRQPPLQISAQTHPRNQHPAHVDDEPGKKVAIWIAAAALAMTAIALFTLSIGSDRDPSTAPGPPQNEQARNEATSPPGRKIDTRETDAGNAANKPSNGGLDNHSKEASSKSDDTEDQEGTTPANLDERKNDHSDQDKSSKTADESSNDPGGQSDVQKKNTDHEDATKKETPSEQQAWHKSDSCFIFIDEGTGHRLSDNTCQDLKGQEKLFHLPKNMSEMEHASTPESTDDPWKALELSTLKLKRLNSNIVFEGSPKPGAEFHFAIDGKYVGKRNPLRNPLPIDGLAPGTHIVTALELRQEKQFQVHKLEFTIEPPAPTGPNLVDMDLPEGESLLPVEGWQGLLVIDDQESPVEILMDLEPGDTIQACLVNTAQQGKYKHVPLEYDKKHSHLKRPNKHPNKHPNICEIEWNAKDNRLECMLNENRELFLLIQHDDRWWTIATQKTFKELESYAKVPCTPTTERPHHLTWDMPRNRPPRLLKPGWTYIEEDVWERTPSPGGGRRGNAFTPTLSIKSKEPNTWIITLKCKPKDYSNLPTPNRIELYDQYGLLLKILELKQN
ncbi:MAG: hypothetical protein CMJ24_11030 [Phycisphaerae bacterium]|nr:hypothetical protein [Phycisphaerae bacterium]